MAYTISKQLITLDKIKIQDARISIQGKRIELFVDYGYDEGKDFITVKHNNIIIEGDNYIELMSSSVDNSNNIYENLAAIIYNFIETKKLI